jgi:hypothetical protein
MKKTATITIKIDADYPDIQERYLAKVSKDFDAWMKEWAKLLEEQWTPIPGLFQPSPYGAIGAACNSDLSVKIKRDGKVLVNTHSKRSTKGDLDD